MTGSVNRLVAPQMRMSLVPHFVSVSPPTRDLYTICILCATFINFLPVVVMRSSPLSLKGFSVAFCLQKSMILGLETEKQIFLSHTINKGEQRYHKMLTKSNRFGHEISHLPDVFNILYHILSLLPNQNDEMVFCTACFH